MLENAGQELSDPGCAAPSLTRSQCIAYFLLFIGGGPPTSFGHAICLTGHDEPAPLLALDGCNHDGRHRGGPRRRGLSSG